MAKKMTTAVILGMLAGRSYIFEDKDTLEEIYGLGADLFGTAEPNEHLTANETRSLNAMINAITSAKNQKARVDILEGKTEGWAGGQGALAKWWKGAKVAKALAVRIDEALERNDVSPQQLINLDVEEGAEETKFPDVKDCDDAKDDILEAIYGSNVHSKPVRGDMVYARDTIIHHTWERHRKRFGRAKKLFQAREKNAQARYEGKYQCHGYDLHELT